MLPGCLGFAALASPLVGSQVRDFGDRKSPAECQALRIFRIGLSHFLLAAAVTSKAFQAAAIQYEQARLRLKGIEDNIGIPLARKLRKESEARGMEQYLVDKKKISCKR